MIRLALRTNRAWLLVISGLLLTACGARSTMELSEYDDAGTEGGFDAKADVLGDVIYDHVNDINGCNPDTCGGCCDDEGDCRTGVEVSACGIGGYACVNCSSFNATCNASNHQCGATQACGPATCPNGCCDDKGTCVSGTNDSACGTGGQACSWCPPDSACDPYYQQCVGMQECGPWNCSGCCDYYGSCNWGGESWACGVGGNYCQDCSSMGLSCDPYSYSCQQTEECGPWNCDGCCDYYGYCNWGGDDWACGWGGNYCDDCWSMGAVCDPYQAACIPQQDCGPWNCDGCCDAYGYCNWGGDNWACGMKGDACNDCSMSGGYCDPDMMMCQYGEDCGPWNCGGCCTNTYPSYCVDGYQPWECGNSGNLCESCYPGQTCDPQPWGGGACGGYYVDGGVADSGSGCGPWNCNGCCTPGGQCRPGTSNNRCGQGGEICENCATQNLICENGNCGP